MNDYVFISHSAADKALADATCARLESAGIRCWIAPRDITPGRMWSEAIIDGINASRLMILIFSRHSNKSPQVSREIERAVNRGMLLLQVRVEDIRPSRALELFISSSQWLDAFPPPAERHLDGLPAAVQRLLAESVSTDEREAQSGHPRIQNPAPSQVRPRTSRRALWVAAMVLGVAVLGILGFNLTRWLKTTPAPPPTVLTIDKRSTVRQVGDTFALQATLVDSSGGARAPIRWGSNDSTVVRITAGDTVFRAIAPGIAVLYAEGGGARDSVQVRVLAAQAPPNPPPSEASPKKPVSERVRPAPTSGAGRSTSASTKTVSVSPPTRDVAAPAETLKPNVTAPPDTLKPKTTASAPAGANLVAFARLCADALRNKDHAWLAGHYGATETAADKDNLQRLSDLVRRKGYAAVLLTAPRLTSGGVEFAMQFQFAGAFGPALKTTGDFLVGAADGAAALDPPSCRVKGTLRLP